MNAPRAASTDAVLEAVCARIRAWLPACREVQPHDGRFATEELQRWAARAPAVRVASLGVAAIRAAGDGGVELDLQLWAFAVAKDLPERSRGAAARAMADRLLVGLPGERWGLAGVGEARQARAENLYTPGLDKLGLALWAVAWRQACRFELAADPTAENPADRPLPAELYAGIAPDIGAGREAAYEQLAGGEGA